MVVVLTDGMTPWPQEAPKGMQVVVGLISNQNQGGRIWAAPLWARVVPIDAAA